MRVVPSCRSQALLLPLTVLICCLLLGARSSAHQGNGGGEWQLLRHSIGISAMHMQVLHNDKVIMFDRTDFGHSNLSLPFGRCRNDPEDVALKKDCTAHSLVYDVATNVPRPLTVQTDTFCSSGAVAPNGRLVQTGGYNDGDRVVRVFSPCSDFEDCDWHEFPNALAARRWYATNHILPDGRIIIVGGRRQFNYEFFPNSDPPEKFDLPFLQETHDVPDENNLYPFVHLLPDGNLFIFANTRSILLDYVSGRILREFPEIPGKNPRNYPSTGSSVLLPIRLSERHPGGVRAVEVLVCGGAQKGSFAKAIAGEFVTALSTCGRLRLTDPSPEWEMETMPMPRVMSDMLILPNGQVLIINGAMSGTAGWQLGRNPALNPVIYQPGAPRGQRFSVMSASPIPRLYHSTAVVLPDGRVLVGGSNPNVNYSFSGVDYPTELRLEAFSPPYLSPEAAESRPRIVALPAGEFGYKQSLTIEFELTSWTSMEEGMWWEEYNEEEEEVEVKMLSPTFTTHSFSMNQRMVVLEMVEGSRLSAPSMYRVTVLSPPTAAAAPPGYYMLFVVHRRIPSPGIWVRIQ
ncbi:aldehyde oxidase GLOX-like [Nymphaea colorata]|uniref:Galactose oxidase-like Early set domain-containing protein n=1 Tax=Nymphaea colorata TaxID=210225 RepID=A0A5K0VCI4_9MAGN|nr:aldehyde oxidase GLOX-like [Nymphaea colorata]